MIALKAFVWIGFSILHSCFCFVIPSAGCEARCSCSSYLSLIIIIIISILIGMTNFLTFFDIYSLSSAPMECWFECYHFPCVKVGAIVDTFHPDTRCCTDYYLCNRWARMYSLIMCKKKFYHFNPCFTFFHSFIKVKVAYALPYTTVAHSFGQPFQISAARVTQYK